MFMGEFQHSIDDRARFIVPAKFREELGEKFIVTKGLEKCLFIYPLNEWDKVVERLNGLSSTRADIRKFSRMFFSGAIEAEADKQSRVVLPANLRTFSGIEKDIIFIGVSSRIEIWDKAAWQEYSDRAADDYEAIAEAIDTNIPL
jgi:MraZ protein